MAKKYKVNLIRTRRSYTIQEIAILLNVDKRTCFRWLDMGLEVIEKNTKPLLVMGYELKRFIGEKQNQHKLKLKIDEYYCFSCRKAVKAKPISERMVKTGKMTSKQNRELFMKVGLCEHCNTKVNRLV